MCVCVCVEALCAVLEYELCPSGEDKLDVMTSLHRTDTGKQRQSEAAARLRLLKQTVCLSAHYTHLTNHYTHLSAHHTTLT